MLSLATWCELFCKTMAFNAALLFILMNSPAFSTSPGIRRLGEAPAARLPRRLLAFALCATEVLRPAVQRADGCACHQTAVA